MGMKASPVTIIRGASKKMLVFSDRSPNRDAVLIDSAPNICMRRSHGRGS